MPVPFPANVSRTKSVCFCDSSLTTLVMPKFGSMERAGREEDRNREGVGVCGSSFTLGGSGEGDCGAASTSIAERLLTRLEDCACGGLLTSLAVSLRLEVDNTGVASAASAASTASSASASSLSSMRIFLRLSRRRARCSKATSASLQRRALRIITPPLHHVPFEMIAFVESLARLRGMLSSVAKSLVLGSCDP